MITIKTAAEINKMRAASKIVAEAFELVREAAAPGVTTQALNKLVQNFIAKRGAKPSFLGYKGFPAATTISVNNEVIHGVPSQRKLVSGDIVSIDIGAYKDGYHGDAARSFIIGAADPEAVRLVQVTEESFFEGVKFARAGCRLHEVSVAIQKHVEKSGFQVVKEFIGHGVGRKLHEDPNIPNYKTKGRGPVLAPGMTLAIEPMVVDGNDKVVILENGWTVVTTDGSLAAHYENTVLITSGEPELLTVL